MKKIFILFIPILFLGCSLNNDEANITFTVPENQNRSATDIVDLGSVSEITFYISNDGENFIMSDDTILYGNGDFYTASDGTIIESINGEDVAITDSETDETSTVWIKSIKDSDTISFRISYGLTKVFTVKVLYDSGEIFIGTQTKTINSLTTNIDITIKQTISSIANSDFNEIEDFLQNDFE